MSIAYNKDSKLNGDVMKKNLLSKFLYIATFIFSILIIVILGNIAIPILYNYSMKLFSILAPFIIGFFFAFLLHTLVDRIEEQGINRCLSVLLVFLVFLILISYLISNLIPIIFNQIEELEEQIPEIYNSVEIFIHNLWNHLDFIPEKYRFYMDDIGNWTLSNFFKFDFSQSKMANLFDSFNILVLTPIITYYFLYDYNNMKRRLIKFLKRKNYRFSYKFLREMDEEIGAYFRGLILIMNLMTIVSTLGFFLIGLDYPLLFGFIVGYTNVIPIIGPYIGGIPAVFFALTKSWKLAILALVVIVLIQTIESNIVTPYVQSKAIDAHPLLILLSFIFFGKIFGIIGMIFAIPILAVILLSIKYFRIYMRIKKIKKSSVNIENC